MMVSCRVFQAYITFSHSLFKIVYDMKFINSHSFVIIFIICLIALFLTGCNSKQKKNINPADIDNQETIEKVLTLSNQKNISEDIPLVSVISLVTTDDANNIYLADPSTLEIHSYTSNLSHRWTVGGKGGGPGLFNMISSLYIDEQHLYAYDHTTSIMILYDIQTGKRLKEWNFGTGGQRINNIQQLNSGEFITTGWDENHNTMVGVYSEDFTKRKYGFVQLREISTTDYPEFEKQVFRSSPGFLISPAKSTIIYTPPTYNGQLSVYKQQSEENWLKTGTINGYTNIEKPLIFHFSSDGNHERSHLSGINPQGGYFHTEFTSRSHGLFKLENGQIAHLSSRLNEDDAWNIIIEYFDSSTLELKNHETIKGITISQQPQKIPLWMDKSGRIYISENSDTPLRILELNNDLE